MSDTDHTIRLTDAEAMRIVKAYNRVKYYPEGQPNGWANMLELRQAIERVVQLLPRAED